MSNTLADVIEPEITIEPLLAANTATVSPYGRGYLGTTASTHAADSKVSISPVFPRNSVKKAINDTVRSTGSSMFAVKSMTFTYEAPVTTYNIYAGQHHIKNMKLFNFMKWGGKICSIILIGYIIYKIVKGVT